MIHSLIKFTTAFSLLALAGITDLPPTTSQAHAASTGKSGLPLPRFVSLKSKRVNMRVGPGKQYQVEWLYQREGLPLEIIQEYDNWRKVRDAEGQEGWILHSLLSGTRTALVAPWKADQDVETIELYSRAGERSSVIALMEPGVVTNVKSCDNALCKVSVGSVEGFVSKDMLWGVYPNEQIED
ncbi:MAG: SH3 domain-containing protein [Pseudomonadota bacterium]